MKNLIFILFLFSFCSCKSQTSSNLQKLKEQDEVVLQFLNTMEEYSFVDKHLFANDNQFDLIKKFKLVNAKYRKLDSICSNSSDTLQLKLFCPGAESLREFYNVLDQDNFFKNKDSQAQKNDRILNLDSLLLHTIPLFKHSEKYYQNIVYENYDSLYSIDEFPSIRIHNIYFSNDRNVAIVVYDILYKPKVDNKYKYFVLKKINGVWWKSLGSI